MSAIHPTKESEVDQIDHDQYFITHSMQPHLDGRYTAFGQVVQGQDVVDMIQQGDVVVRATLTKSGN